MQCATLNPEERALDPIKTLAIHHPRPQWLVARCGGHIAQNLKNASTSGAEADGRQVMMAQDDQRLTVIFRT